MIDIEKIYTDPSLLLQSIGAHQKVVFTNGCFDLLHVGHVDLLCKAKQFGDVLIVGINSDESIKRLKGEGRPICAIDHRMQLLASLQAVDFVIPFNEPTPILLIKALQPRVLVKGGDYKAHEIVGYNEVIENGGQVEIINFVHDVSSSQIIEKIRSLNYDPS